MLGSDFSYLHMTNPSNIIYLQEWSRDEISFDDIEFSERYFTEISGDDGSDSHVDRGASHINGSSGAFGSSINNKSSQRRHREFVWQDLDLQRFLSDHQSSNRANNSPSREVNQLSNVEIGGDYNGEDMGNLFGGTHVYYHDHTIVDTVYKRPISEANALFATSMPSISQEGFSGDNSNTTNTTTTSLSRNTNRLTMSGSANNILNTP